MSYEDDDGPENLADQGAVKISQTVLEYSAEQMFSAIVREAAQQITQRTLKKLCDSIASEVREQVNAQVGAKVAEVLDGTVQPTNEWGEPKGKATSLRDVVAASAREYMGQKVDKEGRPNTYNADMTRLDYVVKQNVAKVFDYTMQSEVKKAVEMARTEAVARMGAVVGDMILKLK